MHLHCFNNSAEYAEQMIDEFPNAYFGFTGAVTFENAHETRRVAAEIVPLNRLLLETDGPYMVRSLTPGILCSALACRKFFCIEVLRVLRFDQAPIVRDRGVSVRGAPSPDSNSNSMLTPTFTLNPTQTRLSSSSSPYVQPPRDKNEGGGGGGGGGKKKRRRRGGVATPWHIPVIAAEIADLRGVSTAEVLAAARENTRAMYGI